MPISNNFFNKIYLVCLHLKIGREKIKQTKKGTLYGFFNILNNLKTGYKLII